MLYSNEFKKNYITYSNFYKLLLFTNLTPFIFISFFLCLVFVNSEKEQKILNDEVVGGLNELDFKNAAQLTKEELYQSGKNLAEINNFKPDIRFPKVDLKTNSHNRVRRNGVSRSAKIWPHGRIPYAISSHYNSHERALLARAVKQYHDKTCVRFVPRSANEPDYLFIGKVDGCFSEVGRTSGIQVLSLDNGCMEYSTIIHEIMHVVGFYHEHERWDRDNFIDIIWQNIDKGALDQFGKVDLSKTSYYGQPYDYKSILHYDSLAFSKNGFPTMLPKQLGLATTIGNAKDFSEIDLTKINRMYKCDKKKQYIQQLYSSFNPREKNFGLSKALIAPNYTPNEYNKNSIYNYPLPNLIGQEYFINFEKKGKTKRPKTIKCEDKITVCWWTRSRCSSPNIYLMMKTLCQKTCKFC